MAAKKLDMTKPYGEVMGDANGCRYVQHGNQYDAQGKYLRKDGDTTATSSEEQDDDEAGEETKEADATTSTTEAEE